MNIIVLDLEWNQDSTGKYKKNEEQLMFEIIEIGAVKLNDEFQIVDRFTKLIKPQIYHTMHKVTEDLIHIDMQELEQGEPFIEVMNQFLEWCGKDYIFATWGPLDLIELQRNMDYYEMKPLWDKPEKYYDVQKLFSIKVLKEKTRKNLEYAIDYFKIEKKEPFHRASSDAYYTAEAFRYLSDRETLCYYSLDTYRLPKTKKEEVKAVFPGYQKHITRGFEFKRELLSDREINSTKCYLCRKNIKKKVRWFTTNQKHYYSISLCDVHGYFKYKIRIRKNNKGEYYAVKTSKMITEEKMNKLLIKWKEEKEIKKIKKIKKVVGKE